MIFVQAITRWCCCPQILSIALTFKISINFTNCDICNLNEHFYVYVALAG